MLASVLLLEKIHNIIFLCKNRMVDSNIESRMVDSNIESRMVDSNIESRMVDSNIESIHDNGTKNHTSIMIGLRLMHCLHTNEGVYNMVS